MRSTLGKVASATLVWLGVAGTALAGSNGPASACGSDTVAQAICMSESLLFGPNGVVPFTTHQVTWALGVVLDAVPLIAPLGVA
jgi:hypothetical protein